MPRGMRGRGTPNGGGLLMTFGNGDLTKAEKKHLLHGGSMESIRRARLANERRGVKFKKNQ